MPETITLRQLEAAGACADQVAEFKRRFGISVEITVALCENVADVFYFNWAAEHLLPPAAFAEYERATAAAFAEYERATAAAFAEHKRATAPAWAEYKRATAPARAEYERARAPAWAEYERVRAVAFARAYRMEGR